MKALVISLEQFQKGEIPEEVRLFIEQNPKPFIILDESSKIKTTVPCKIENKSKRTQAILRLSRFGHRCILTGTFMSQSPVNAYDQMSFLCPNFFSENIYAFAARYTIRRSLKTVRGVKTLIKEADYNRIHKMLNRPCTSDIQKYALYSTVMSEYGITKDDADHIKENKQYSPYKHLDELYNRIGDTCFFVNSVPDVQRAEKVYNTISVSLNQEQRKLYNQLLKEMSTDNIATTNYATLYIYLQDICNGFEPVQNEDETVQRVALQENEKIKALLPIVEEHITKGRQIVIWASRTCILNATVEALNNCGYSTAIYDGKVNKKKRTEDYNSFAHGKVQIMVANQASCAYGVDKLKEADVAIYICNSYSVEEREQSEKRIYRGNVTRTKYFYDIVCKGTCESRVLSALKIGKQLVFGKMSKKEFVDLVELRETDK